MEKILIVSLFTLLSLLPVQAQKRVGDFIESTSYNEDKRGAVRELQYVPEYDVVVCKNGNNRSPPKPNTWLLLWNLRCFPENTFYI